METKIVSERVHRLYPDGFTSNSLGELNKLLSDGWMVKMVITCQTRHDGGVISDYVLQKQMFIQEPKKDD